MVSFVIFGLIYMKNEKQYKAEQARKETNCYYCEKSLTPYNRVDLLDQGTAVCKRCYNTARGIK